MRGAILVLAALLATPAEAQRARCIRATGSTARFDVEADECEAVPKKLRALAERLVAAIEADDADAFAKLLPSRIERNRKTWKRSAVKAAVETEGVKAWLGLADAPWILERYGERDYALYLDTSKMNDTITVIVLRRSGRTWKVRGLGSIDVEVWAPDLR